ncbi:hypothetical protein [Qipengyuania sp. MTN3-11]|uniref:hypothetical protein n=1 Tax=Qipengyuania sp. MTN3-11 TaxID=3056557 RepID=UPI0036F2B02C
MATRAAGGAAGAGTAKFNRDERRRDADHESFLAHKRFRYLWVALALVAACFASYALVDVSPRHNGGSWYGYTLGTIGALLIVWLTLLGVRKRRMTPGRWSLKAWTSAHVYLGLSLVVIGTLHTGFQLGWNVHTLAWALMMLVIASGIWGIIAYANLPQKLSANRGEMTREAMVESLAAIDRQLDAAAQPLSRGDTDLVIAALEKDIFKAGVVSRLTGRLPRDPTKRALERLSVGRERSEVEALEKVRALLGRRQAQVLQIRRQMRTKALLEVWLFVHIPLTIALLAALTAHIVSVFYYW